MFVIINYWYQYNDIHVVTDNGHAKVFDSETEAEKWAKNLNGFYKVVEL